MTEAEWERFVAEGLTPRFPKGFTAWDASGQWQDSSGAVVLERSKIVRLVTDDVTTVAGAVHAVVAEYRRRFQQEAVLQTESEVCVGWT